MYGPLDRDSIFATALTIGLVFAMIQPTTSSIISSTYSGTLSSRSSTYSRPGGNLNYYYYQAIQVTVSTTDTYTFTSSSRMDTYGSLYYDSFNPSSPSQNLIVSNDDSADNWQFQIMVALQSERTYILVITTYHNATTGSFSIIADGPASVTLALITPSTTLPVVITTTSSSAIPSTYSGTLSSSSPMFSRPNSTAGNYYYYQAVQVTVYATGIYSFTSTSSMDTYGCFYNGLFNPSCPSQNLITSDDNSAGNGQFRISHRLQSGRIYILVVTTFNFVITGRFSITAVGPAWIGLTSVTPSTSQPIRTTTSQPCGGSLVCKTDYDDDTLNAGQIVGITFGCVIFCIGMLGVYAARQKQKQISNRINIVSTGNQNLRVQDLPLTSMHRNAPRTIGIHVPYIISMDTTSVTVEEEPPPSYESFISSLKVQEQGNANRF